MDSYSTLDGLSIYFFLSCYGDHHILHSFPTRRSSDLPQAGATFVERAVVLVVIEVAVALQQAEAARPQLRSRSEEHTSELQSRRDLVCRLLLEKKNYPRWAGSGRPPSDCIS